MSKPDCFPDQKMFDEWKRLAKLGNEDAHPCEDCTAEYQQSVGLRCKTRSVQFVFLVPGRSSVMLLKKQAQETIERQREERTKKLRDIRNRKAK